MRLRTSLAIFILLSALAAAQSMSPDALYERGIDAITGVGERHNDQAGIEYFHHSSDLGYGPAQVALGYYYEMGIVPGNQGQPSLDLYKKAAQQGDSLAAWLLGRRYFLGIGVPRDPDLAKKWLKVSADQKNPYGAYYLGRLIAEHDPAKALELYKIAADQGLPQAQYFYGKALKDGQGAAPDLANGYVWLVIAVDAGYVAAGPDMNELRSGGHLTLDEINQSTSKAREMEQVVIRAVTARGCSGWEGESAEFPVPPPPSLQRFCH
ncbi:MAG: tetratricopeptide repeat protein [Terriglobales bacterium]